MTRMSLHQPTAGWAFTRSADLGAARNKTKTVQDGLSHFEMLSSIAIKEASLKPDIVHYATYIFHTMRYGILEVKL